MSQPTEHPFVTAWKMLGGARIARATGVSPQLIAKWKTTAERDRNFKLPAHHCAPVEEATNYLVTRYDLRPDVFGTPEDAMRDLRKVLVLRDQSPVGVHG